MENREDIFFTLETFRERIWFRYRQYHRYHQHGEETSSILFIYLFFTLDWMIPSPGRIEARGDERILYFLPICSLSLSIFLLSFFSFSVFSVFSLSLFLSPSFPTFCSLSLSAFSPPSVFFLSFFLFPCFICIFSFFLFFSPPLFLLSVFSVYSLSLCFLSYLLVFFLSFSLSLYFLFLSLFLTPLSLSQCCPILLSLQSDNILLDWWWLLSDSNR